MRRVLSVSTLLVLGAVLAAAAVPDAPTFAATLRRAGDCAADEGVAAHAHHWAGYYAALRPHATVEHRGAVVDCISYMDQPALVEAAKAGDTATLSAARENLLRAKRANVPVDSQSAQCPADTVALTRPAVRLSEDNKGCPAVVIPPPKRRPTAHGPRPDLAKPATDVGGYSYEYVLSPFTNVGAGATRAWGVFGVGMANDGLPAVTAGSSHAINQLWWTTTEGRASTTVTLEGGWITSSYWSFTTDTSLFVFSTPDDYSNTSRYGPDQYNQAGGFIQYPGTPSLGTARDSVQYQLMYAQMNNSAGFEAYLRPFTMDSETGSLSFSSEAFAFGYYPMARYIWGPPSFTWFQVGYESCIESTVFGTAQVQASGDIFGWGANSQGRDIEGQFTPTNAGVYSATYDARTWTNGGFWTSPESVHFTGDNKQAKASEDDVQPVIRHQG